MGMSKRQTALEVIRIEWAKYGKDTRESVRAYVENRVSFKARTEAAEKGLRQFNATYPATDGEVSR